MRADPALRFDLSLARELGLPATIMRTLMPMTEYRAWQALASIEGQIADLVRDGTDPRIATQMAWTRTDLPDPEEG